MSRELEEVAGPTQFGEMPAAVGAIAVWVYMAVTRGPVVAAQVSFALLLGVGLAAWTLLMRLRFNNTTVAMTIGPWRRAADLTKLDSITWKMTGGWRSQGTIFVRDRTGLRVPIYVGRFKRTEEWSRVLLDAAARTGATIDPPARKILITAADRASKV